MKMKGSARFSRPWRLCVLTIISLAVSFTFVQLSYLENEDRSSLARAVDPTDAQLSARASLRVSTTCASMVSDLSSTTRVLVSVAAGLAHRERVNKLVRTFLESAKDDPVSFSFVVFHWDPNDVDEELWENAIDTHIYESQQVKLGFASKYLTPERVCAFDYVFIWDGDVRLSDGFDAGRLVQVLQENRVDVAQPALGKDSSLTYKFSKARPGVTLRSDTWFIEIGFIIYRTEVWMKVWSLLQIFPFRIWWFDVLPWSCILDEDGVFEDTRFAVVHEQWIIHESDGKTLRIDRSQTSKEKRWRDEVISKYGCCKYLSNLPESAPQKEHQKCRCSRPGLHC